MEILILGVILFVVGVAATIVYDKHKDRLQDLSKIKESFGRPDTFLQNEYAKIKASLQPAPKVTTRKPTTRKKKTTTTVSIQDGSINSTMTLEELIEKIEKMKKKL